VVNAIFPIGVALKIRCLWRLAATSTLDAVYDLRHRSLVVALKKLFNMYYIFWPTAGDSDPGFRKVG
jgi:hypothetical protein